MYIFLKEQGKRFHSQRQSLYSQINNTLFMDTDIITFLRLNYSLSSSTGNIEEERYINKYNIEVYEIQIDKNDKESASLIGKVNVKLFLWELCIEDNYWVDDLFSQLDHNELGGLLFDYDTNSFKKEWQEKIDESFNSNILYLDRIEILPEYRGKGYGKLITKDILLRLNSSYGIAILKAFPLQLEVSHPNSSKQDSEWNTKMNFKQMEQDSNIAKKQLYNFYKKMGFKRYKKYGILY